jgi:hypothetical protein
LLPSGASRVTTTAAPSGQDSIGPITHSWETFQRPPALPVPCGALPVRIFFTQSSRARLWRARPDRARPRSDAESTEVIEGDREWREGESPRAGRVAGGLATPGRQPAAPYGRKPTGRGAAAGPLPPLPQADSHLSNAPAMTATAELSGLSSPHRTCSRRARSQ